MTIISGLGFGVDAPAEKVAGYIAKAEDLGYDGIAWVGDSSLIWRDVYVTLALAAKRTRTIGLGTGVTNPVTRHLSVIAGAIATLNELAPGRMVLGLGTGDSSLHTLHRSPARLDRLKDAVTSLRSLIQGEDTDVEGTKIRLAWRAEQRQQIQKMEVPVYMACTGTRSLRLAGAIADGIIIGVGAHPDLVQWALENIRLGADSAGRDMRELTLEARIICYPDRDVARARSVVGGAAASKANNLARYAKDESFRKHLPKELIGDIEKVSKSYDYYEHERTTAAHTTFLSERLVDRIAIVGPPSSCISKLEALMKETGLKRFSFATYGIPDMTSYLERLRKDVLSPLR